MTAPEVVQCYDGHFRRIVYGVGPYIADYEEQVIVAGVVKGWCGRSCVLFLYQADCSCDTYRCVAPPGNLDNGGHSRVWEHAMFLLNEFGLRVVWDEYGIAGKCAVSRLQSRDWISHFQTYGHSLRNFQERTYMNFLLRTYCTSSLKVSLRITL
jgi:hypothetical protein